MMIRLVYIMSLIVALTELRAQDRTVTGIVKDASTKQALPYCNVVIKGQNKGATTDVHGKFSLTNITDNTDIIVSYVGYASDTVRIGVNQNNLTIWLKPDAKSLNEVVVVSATMKEVSKMNSPQYTPKRWKDLKISLRV